MTGDGQATSERTLAIEVRGLVRRFGEVQAVDGLDLCVPRGVCQGLLGPNGAGKTTTINILVGLDRPDAGVVRVLGRDRSGVGNQAGGVRDVHGVRGAGAAANDVRERIGVQLQETQFFDKLTCLETLRLFRSFYRDGRDPDDVLALVGLEEKRSARTATLSGGQKQRLSLGCALVNRPEILFLDEPTTGLDPQARRRVWEIVEDFKREGGTVLLTTHYMDEAEQLCDSIVIVDHGRSIAEGSPREIIASLEAESLIEFTLIENGIPDAALLSAIPGILRVQVDGARATLFAMALHEAVPVLVATLRERGLALGELRTHRPTLEDVFVTLTGRNLRDG